jgi:nucleoside-diphosphate-sugar epimerase
VNARTPSGWTLVAGCGYVGSAFASLSTDPGAWRSVGLSGPAPRIVGLRRSHVGLRAYPVVGADLLDARALTRALPSPITQVVYLASAEERSEPAYRRAYVEGLERLLGALRTRGDEVRRLLFVSSTAVYGEQRGEWVDETTTPAPLDATSRCLLEGERIARSLGERACVVRLAGIYGPGRTRMIREAATGQATVGPAPSYTNRIHRDDCALLLATLIARPTVPPIVVGVDDDPADRADVLRWLTRELGQPEPVVDPLRAPAPHKRCRSVVRHEIGFSPRYASFREGYAPLLAELLRP